MLSAVALALAACGQGESDATEQSGNASSENEQIQVMATFYPMYDFTRQVVGDEGQVELMPAGTDSHDYEPSAKDMARSKMRMSLSTTMKTWKCGFLRLKLR